MHPLLSPAGGWGSPGLGVSIHLFLTDNWHNQIGCRGRCDQWMERRAEDRVLVQSPARVAPIDQAGSETYCLVAEVTMAGLKLIGGEGLAARIGTHIGVDLPGLLVLAEVRYCYQRGTKFIVGAQRLGSVLKSSLPGEARSAWIETLRKLTSHLRVKALVAPRKPAARAVSPLFAHARHPHPPGVAAGFGRVRSAVAKPVIRILPLRQA